jgi:hypothetical protein
MMTERMTFFMNLKRGELKLFTRHADFLREKSMLATPVPDESIPYGEGKKAVSLCVASSCNAESSLSRQTRRTHNGVSGDETSDDRSADR